MYGGSSKRGGRGGGGGGPARNRNSFPPPTNRHPSPVGRMSSGGGGSAAPRQRNNTTSVKAAAAASSRTVEETFSLVPRESPSAFGMIIRLAPDLVEEIKRVEAQGGAAKIKFDAFPNNSTGNIINVGGKEFKFTWSRERGDVCDIYEEHQSGEDGNGVLIESGCAWRKLNVQRTLDESTTSHMKMRSVEAEQRTKSRKAIVLDPGNPSLTKQLALAEASPWRMSNKQKKEPPPKKRKIDPPPVPIGGPKPSFRPGASTPALKNRLSASPGPSPTNQYNTPPSYGIGNIAKTHAANENVTQVQTKGSENMLASEKDPSTWENNALRDTSERRATNVNKEIDLQTLLVDLLKEAPMSFRALEKAVGDRIPNAAKKIESILENIANFQAPRYFLKQGAELESYKKHSPDSRSSPEHQQLLPITECNRDELAVPGGNNMEKFPVGEQKNGEISQDCLHVHLAEQLSAQENVDIEHHSPDILQEEKRSENREGQARSSSDSDSDSDNSDSGSDSKSAAGSDSGSSSDSEASSNSKEGSDEDVDIMSDGDREPRQTIQSAEREAIDLLGHGSNAVEIKGHDSDAVDIDGHDSDAVDIDGHGSDAVDVEGNSSDEGHGSEADRKEFSDNWKMEATTGTNPTANEEVGISGQEHLDSGHDKLRERQNFIGQLFDDTENSTKDNLEDDKPDISERLAKDQNQKAVDLEHYSQKSARVKNIKSQSSNQLPALGKDSQRSERKYDVELRNASPSQTIDPLRGLQKSFIEKSNRHGQMKPVDSSGKNKYSDALGNLRKSDVGDHLPHEMLSSRPGKAFRDNQRDDVHLKNIFPRNKKDGESAIRPSLFSETSNRKLGELDGSDKDLKNVSGLSIGSSPLDSQRTYLAKLPKGNGSVLEKQVSELELGELPEPFGEDTALKQLEEKSSFRQSNLKPSTSEKCGIDSDKRRSKKSDSIKSAPSHAINGIKELPEHVEDSEKSQKWALQSHGQNLTGTDTQIGSQNKNLEDTAYKSRQKDSRARVRSSVEGYGETNKKTPVIKHGSKRASTSRSSRESKRHASGSISNSINGYKDATSIPGDSVVREKRMTFDEDDSFYLKYEKASPELKEPISDHLQYKAYMQEYLDKYDSYCSVNKILESYRNDFQKLGQDLAFAKGRDMERYNKIVEQIKNSYCKYGERHKRLKKVFVVLHEELKQLKQRMKDYASSHGKD